MKIYIIHADDFAAVHVDDLLVEQVTLKQEEVFRLLHCRPGVQISSAAEERVSSETQGICGNQAISGFRANDERRDPVGIFLRSDGYLAHTSSNSSARIEDAGAKQSRECNAGHMARIQRQKEYFQ